jgi:hypothetical protein
LKALPSISFAPLQLGYMVDCPFSEYVDPLGCGNEESIHSCSGTDAGADRNNPQGKSCHFPAEAQMPEMSLLSA